MYSYKFKKYVIFLSFSSFIFGLLIGALSLLLLLNEGPFNLITKPVAGIKMCVAAVLIQCLFTYLLTVMYRPDLYDEKSHFQLYSCLKSCGLLLLASIIFHIISILYGAPVLTSVEETYHFAVLMTVLVILPMCIFCGPVVENWFCLFTSSSYLGAETVVYYTCIMSILGSWVGAAAIPLDWDRPWQDWPISCAVGGVYGYCCGLLLAAVQLPRELLSNKSKVF